MKNQKRKFIFPFVITIFSIFCATSIFMVFATFNNQSFEFYAWVSASCFSLITIDLLFTLRKKQKQEAEIKQ